jgi:acetyl-CoA C-acetyltransferase
VTGELDPRTPVIVGVGQASERIGDPGYRGRSAVDLAAAAVRAALADAAAGGADAVPAATTDVITAGTAAPGAAAAIAAAIAAAVGTIAGVRQFETSAPGARAPLGRSDNFPRSVAGRAGLAPQRAILEVGGGQAPQHLVNEFAAAIAAGRAEVVLLAGAEAISTVEHFARLGGDDPARPDFTEHADGSLEDRGYGLDGLVFPHLAAHGLTGAPSQYALIDNARRARLKQTREEYAAAMGALFAPFTKVAAANPHASAPVERTAAELVTPTAANRPIADPYTRYIVAREKVNQGAAVLLMPVAAARRLGVPADRWVFLHGHADLRERPLMERADLSASPAAVLAARHALEVAGITAGDLATMDLYSCFPAPVFNICDGLGIEPDDPRGLTLTGGLPFFGGAGNNYSMHAIAETVQRARSTPGSYGFVGANGGIMSKYSAGVYSTKPGEWTADRSADLQAEIDAWPAPAEARRADGWATVETYTVRHSRDGKRSGIVIGRLEADGRRFVASGDDDELLALLTSGEPVGGRVYTLSFGTGNRVTTSRQRMRELYPPEG